MITNISAEHKYKLGDKVWVKASYEAYKTCKSCKGQGKYEKVVKAIRCEITSINIRCTLQSKPGINTGVDYMVKYKLASASAHEYQLSNSKKEAEGCINTTHFYGI